MAFSFLLSQPTLIYANDIPGMAIIQPPTLQGKLQFQLSNDYFTVLSNQDDYRTQQISLSGYVNEKWLLVVDQSLLTARDQREIKTTPTNNKGRLDQLSASLAYRAYFKHTKTNTEQLLIGFGVRSVGDFNGSKIQNGAHKLFRNKTLNLPYVSTKQTDGVILIRASKQHYFTNNIQSNWRHGYWLDGATLFSSDGQSDGTVGLYGVTQYDDLNFWSGLRFDWRNGYNQDYVQQTVARQEQGIAIAIGISLGPIRWETIQGIAGSNNSFGRIVLTATSETQVNSDFKGSQFSYQFSMFSPYVTVQSQFRWSAPSWRSKNLARYSIVFDYRYATPVIDKNLTQFEISNQSIIGVEALLISKSKNSWVLPYLMVGIGTRTEYIEGKEMFDDQQSNNATGTVVVSDAGLRIQLAGKTNSWLVQLQLGYTFWQPLQTKKVLFNGQQTTLLKSNSSSVIGVNFQFDF